LSCPHNDELVGLAKQNFEFRQSIYKYELEELKRLPNIIFILSCLFEIGGLKTGLSDIGFGREKTTYCYFVIASSSNLPHDSDIRMMAAKSAIVITVADDFFYMEASLSEWDAKDLSNHSKIIFDALYNLVSEIASKYFQQEGRDITKTLQDIYLEAGMTSIATHAMVLPASCFLKPRLPDSKLKPVQYENITKLLMDLITNVYLQMEREEGKMNFVLLYLKENPEADIEVVVAFTREILDQNKKDSLKHVLMDGFCDFPKSCKHLHLSCMKVFQMFFNSSNGSDSNTEMLEEIKKAIYIPLEIEISKPVKPPPLYSGAKMIYPTMNYQFKPSF
ncbi:hypothetical protein ACB092_05G117700, partial [Castanea dentata]